MISDLRVLMKFWLKTNAQEVHFKIFFIGEILYHKYS